MPELQIVRSSKNPAALFEDSLSLNPKRVASLAVSRRHVERLRAHGKDTFPVLFSHRPDAHIERRIADVRLGFPSVMAPSNYESSNRSAWNRDSDHYQARHGEFLKETAEACGVWRIPEPELNVLGDLAGKRVLELGCGGAQWSVALALRGVDVTGLDLSDRQLVFAQANIAAAGITVPLVHASAANLPFAEASFDVVFCDHGAMSFADPSDTVPHVARILRPGGLLAFCLSSGLNLIAHDPVADRLTTQLQADYFGMRSFTWPDDSIDFQLPHGQWIRLARDCGLEVEDLIEVQAPEAASSTYRDAEAHAWARRWPMEEIWRLRKY